MKKFFSTFSSLIICILLAFSFLTFSSASYTVNSSSRLYEEIAKDISEWKKEAVYYTSFEPKSIKISEIRERSDKIHYIASKSFFGISWEYQRTGNGYRLEIEYQYYMTENEYNRVKKECKTIAEEIKNKSEYEKIKHVHDYLILNCEYSYIKNGPQNCLFKGKAACNGYALAFQMIMDECGIPCKYTANSLHAWNTVFLNDRWYNIDLTWDDAAENGVSYDYFLKSNFDFPDHKGAEATALASYNMPSTEVEIDAAPPNYYGYIVVIAGFVVIIALFVVWRKNSTFEYDF